MKFKPDPCVAHVAAWIEQLGRSLIPDFDAAEAFLQALDPSVKYFSFRTFSDSPYTRHTGKDPLERAIHGGLKTCWDELVELNRRGAAVSVTINHTNGQGRTAADIEQVRALFLDDDGPPDRLDRFPLPPHIQVRTSPGHYHHYWRVEGMPLFSFCGLQQQLARRYGGDNKVMALNQSMQLPGIWRRKSLKRPVMSSIHRLNLCKPYPMETLQRLFDLKNS